MSVKPLKEKQLSTVSSKDTKKLNDADDEENSTVEDPDAGLSMYEKFLKAKKTEWRIFNLSASVLSFVLAFGTYYVMKSHDGLDCRNLCSTLSMVLLMHCVNCGETLLNLVGLERKLCNNWMACMFMLFEITMVAYM
jgi:hypothetical protein